MRIRLPFWPLQKAVYATLSGALSEPVLAYVPKDTAPPYVVIGDFEAGDLSSGSEGGTRIEFEILAFTDYKGPRQATEILEAVIDAMTNATPDLSADSYEAHGLSLLEAAVEQLDTETFSGRARFALFVIDNS